MEMPTLYNCRCSLIRNPTCAEGLLDLAESILMPRSSLVIAENTNSENFGRVLALYNLGLDLRRSKVISLRAIVENWDQLRINRELY